MPRIKCVKTIQDEHLRQYVLSGDSLSHSMITCEECPHAGSSGDCKTCYGQVVVSVKEDITPEETVKSKSVYRNYYTVNKNGFIKEIYNHDKFIKTTNISYEVPKYDTHQKLETGWAYTDRPVNHSTACAVCKRKNRARGTSPECHDSSNHNLCTVQKQRVFYLY